MTSHGMLKFNYRPDIDGLRAIAVLSVITFHFTPSLLPGGFVGVDIFFVISGFLISLHLLSDFHATSTISFREFYRRRLKRIFPSLFLVCIVTLGASLLILLPTDLVRFRDSLVKTVLSLSNVYFSKGKDYFSPETNEFPLLHTWSLSVEEQFYFFWPILIFLFCRFLKKERYILMGFLVIIAASVTYAQVQSLSGTEAKNGSYFSLLSRVSELALGGLAANLHFKRRAVWGKFISSALSWVGLGMILSSFYLIRESSTFPGVWVLLPCVGTALILEIEQGSSVLSRVLSLRPVTWIGLHSYALYLWHWPVLAFYHYLGGANEVGAYDSLFLLAAIFALAFLSRSLVEVPLNHTRKSLGFVIVCFFVIPAAGLLGISHVIKTTKGFPGRIGRGELLREVETFQTPDRCHNVITGDCVFGNRESTKKILLIGDSHAGHDTAMFIEALNETPFALVARSSHSCPPFLHDLSPEVEKKIKELSSDGHCLQYLKKFQEDFARSRPLAVILVACWYKYPSIMPEFKENLLKTISLLRARRIPVFLVESIPAFSKKEYAVALRRKFSPLFDVLPLDRHEIVSFEPEEGMDLYNDEFEQAVKGIPGVTFLRPVTYALNQGIRLPVDDGLPLYFDGSHLNDQGSRSLGKLYRKEFRSKLCSQLDCSP